MEDNIRSSFRDDAGSTNRRICIQPRFIFGRANGQFLCRALWKHSVRDGARAWPDDAKHFGQRRAHRNAIERLDCFRPVSVPFHMSFPDEETCSLRQLCPEFNLITGRRDYILR